MYAKTQANWTWEDQMREDFSSFSHCCVVDCLIANWNFVSIRLFFSFVKFSEKKQRDVCHC